MIAPSKAAKQLSKELIDPAAATLQRLKTKKRASSPSARPEDPPEEPRSKAKLAWISKLPIRTIPLAQLERHPENRHPTEASIEKTAASIKERGLLEAIVVRTAGGTPDKPRYQIISGETRTLAYRKLKVAEIDAKVITCSNVEALELLAIFNAERTDLNAIEKAEMIQVLCNKLEDGGAAMTREQAAKIYGLETGAAASNLLGLLKLPKVWRDVVASGEFPQTFARILVPYAPATAALEALFKEYKSDMKSDCDWAREHWESRDEVERNVDNEMDKLLRPIEKGHELHFDSELFEEKLPKGVQTYRYSDRYQRLFELTPEIEAKLGIVELQIDAYIDNKKVKKPLRYATNVVEYDKLQIPLIIARVDKGAKKSIGSAGKEPKKKKLSPAEQKKADADRQKQLKARIDGWRHAWLKRILADAFGNSERCPAWQAYRFALWLSTKSHLSNSIDADDCLGELIKVKSLSFRADCITPISEETLPALAHKFAAACLSHVDNNPKFTAFRTEDLEAFARDLKIDLAAEWLELPQEDLATFLELHQGAQLEPLAKEWGIFLKEGTGRKDRLKLILGSDKKKPLPKCVTASAVGKKGGK